MPAPSADHPLRPMRVLSLGLPRTGTASMCEALTLIGLKDVHHGIRALGHQTDWHVLERAADASFPCLPTHTPNQPFTRKDWDQVFGPCEAVTDIAAPMGPQLIEAYPEAKVVLVQRDFEKWWRSIDEEILQETWSKFNDFIEDVVEPALGSRMCGSSRKILLGMWGVDSHTKVDKEMSKRAYDAHYDRIRAMMAHRPPEDLLEFQLGDGFGPLCDFLGEEVPQGWARDQFPRINDAEELRRVIWATQLGLLKKFFWKGAPWVASALVVGAGVMAYQRQ